MWLIDPMMSYAEITAFRRRVCGAKYPEWIRRIEALHLAKQKDRR